MSYSTISKKVGFCTSFFTFHFTLLFYILRTDKNTANLQVLLMEIQEYSDRSYPSIVARHQTISQYSIINQKTIHNFIEAVDLWRYIT